MFVKMKCLPLLMMFCVYEYFHFINTQKTCPENYRFSVSKEKCIECEDGYLGLNCSLSCRFPSYGDDCQSLCQCRLELCSHISGCAYDADNEDDGSSNNILISVLAVCGIFLIIGAFVVISRANRKFFTRHLRNNAHYVASVMAEQSSNTLTSSVYHRTANPVNTSTATDNGVYAFANTMRYENVNIQ
ncbi:uncharacterized protein LOC125676099 isoform X1 [Ostrea edulis]|uniref:uncharacterized protein LOC125676099 isoform X1 n=1 Tax=Ostrea edulis TaxID=37623 RepID=UPI0024AEB567|nr:uncharacterized protein LOC125676099 isoform X1 [Ostrea edulis]